MVLRLDKLGRDWSSLTLEETKPLKPFWSPFLVGAGCGWGTTFPPLVAGWACWGCWGWGGSNLSSGGGEKSSCLLGENGSWYLTKLNWIWNILTFSKMSIIKINIVVFSERPAPASSKCSRFFILFNKINISMTESREQGYHFSAGSDLQWSPVQRLSNNK